MHPSGLVSAASARADRPCPSSVLRLVATTMVLVWAGLLLLAGPGYGQDVADWSGAWDTKWRGGGAHLLLEQHGARVTGGYPLYDGHVEGRARGRLLTGRWSEGDRSGEFLFVQSPDGHSFMGRFADSSEWWTGVRVDSVHYQSVPVDQSSPMTTMRSFLQAMNEGGADNIQRPVSGAIDLTGKAAALIDVTPADRQGANLVDYTRRLFSVIDGTTFRLWTLPHDGVDGDEVTVTLGQAGTDVTFDVTFRRKNGRWFIVGPPLAALDQKRSQLLAARGVSEETVYDPRKLASPRDTFKTLLGGFVENGTDPSHNTLDLRELSVAVRSHEADLLTRYLKKVLDRIGFVHWQEIPDDPKSRVPYVHLEHPAGNIVVAPVETDDGVKWQFTPDTLANIRSLYSAVEAMPIAPDLQRHATTDLYFETRSVARNLAPELTARTGPLERWQWLLLGLACVLGIGIGFLASGIVFGIAHVRGRAAGGTVSSVVIRTLKWSVRILCLGLFLLAALQVLGLPDLVATPVQAFAWMAIATGLVPIAWHLIGSLAENYRRRWVSPGYHETLISLSAGVARVAVIVAAFLLVADALAIPYQGVLAGLGIGGLAVALAAQPTLQNFLSGLTLYADRPISVGDFCRFGDKLGTVEHIGMRSTRLRSLDRTVISVPNSEFANMQLENYTHRDRVCFKMTLQLRYETTSDQLRYVIAELRKLLIAHPRVVDDPCRVRFAGFGEYSLNVEIFTYILTPDYGEFTAMREDILLHMMAVMDEAGVQFAFPSQIEYQTPDTPIDAEKRAAAEQRVEAWRGEQKLPFPDYAHQERDEFRNSLPYPPEGSAITAEAEETLASQQEAARERRRWRLAWWRSRGDGGRLGQ